MTEISEKRLKELEFLEYKMQCLEEYYKYVEEEEKKEVLLEKKKKKVFDEIQEILSLGIEKPAGDGCGYGFTEESQKDCYLVFDEYIKGVAND